MTDAARQSERPAKVGAVLVVGAGIGGMQAALDLANAGLRVTLVEETTAIGGRMAQLDKTFPTNDCSMCTISPKLIEVDKHLNIDVVTNADVVGLEGEAGDFRATIRRRPRFVDLDKCNACGDCIEKCPVEVPSEFDENSGHRKAIFKRYPQAIPGAMAISKAQRPPCVLACPARVNCQGYVALIGQGRFAEAYALIRQRNPFPAVCGRVCHHPCESNCNRRELDEPVAVNPLKRFAADWVAQQRAAGEEAAPPPKGQVDPDKPKVAVIGGGPGGLTAARELTLRGYPVTLFEAHEELGGTMLLGVPGYRLPDDALRRDVADVVASGFEVRTGQRLGRDISLDSLRRDGYRATLLAIGCTRPAALARSTDGSPIRGTDLSGVHLGLDLLRDVKLGRGLRLDGKVVVIGGGNVAIDAAMTARRQGAAQVDMVMLESRDEMPAHAWEIEDALDEGIRLNPSWGPREIVGTDGRVTGVKLQRCLRVFDQEGRFAPTFDATESTTLDADHVIIAIGQRSDLSFLADDDPLWDPSRRFVQTDGLSLRTNVDDVFACGDMVGGPASVVEAIAQGHEAAESIDRFLRDEDLAVGRGGPDPEPAGSPPHWFPLSERAAPERLSPERRDGYAEIERTLDEAAAVAEARRCMACGICSECGACVEACDAGAILHAMLPEESTVAVGAVLLAPGFEPFDPRLRGEYGFGDYPNVLTSLQFERLLSASGPRQGHVVRPSDLKEPKRVAWIQCVGSRDVTLGNDYCSSVCCMAAIKEARMAIDHAPGLEATIFYNDIRAHGKGCEVYFEDAKRGAMPTLAVGMSKTREDDHMPTASVGMAPGPKTLHNEANLNEANLTDAKQNGGVRFQRGIISTVKQRQKTKNLVLGYVAEDGRVVEEEFDLVVLSVGLRPSASTARLADVVGIERDRFGFCLTDPLTPGRTSRSGVYVAGTFAGPIDIPETVMSASAAAALAGEDLHEARGTLIHEKTFPPERDVAGELPRIGVFVCRCGTNIARVVGVESVVEYAASLPGVVHVEENLYTCSADTQRRIVGAIEEHRLNRIVVASCTPRTHEPLFQETLREAGLNRHLFEMANIRDQCSWVHFDHPSLATFKAKDLVRMAVARAATLGPFGDIQLTVDQRAIVLGTGVAGMTAALSLARQGFEVALVERDTEPGGIARRLHHTLDGTDPREFVAEMLDQVEEHPLVRLHTGAQLEDFSGHVGRFTARFRQGDRTLELGGGAIVVATGGAAHEPVGYDYAPSDVVVTQLELEQRLDDPEFIAGLDEVVMIQCIGSRDEQHPYCSRVCCQEAVKNALALKRLNPKTRVYVVHRDVRTYGFDELHYQRARDAGVVFLRVDDAFAKEVAGGSFQHDIRVPCPRSRGHVDRDFRHGHASVAMAPKSVAMAPNPNIEREQSTGSGTRESGRMVVPLPSGRAVELRPDLVVLSAGIRPDARADVVSRVLKIPRTRDGFFLEAHMKLRPLDLPTDGIFVAGLAHGPKSIAESIGQAQGAAARAATVLARPVMDRSGMISEVDPSHCAACLTCARLCPYGVPMVNEDGVAFIEPASCRGCGVCAAACPRRAIATRHHRDEQVVAKTDALFGDVEHEATFRETAAGETH